MLERFGAERRDRLESFESRQIYETFVSEIIAKAGPDYINRFRDFRNLYEDFLNYGQSPYQPRIEAALCGYSAAAIKAGLDLGLSQRFHTNIIYGHHKNSTIGHYWTDTNYFANSGRSHPIAMICATSGQFDEQYKDKIIVDRPWWNFAYNLKPYRIHRIRQGSINTTTVEYLREHGHMLPVIDSLLDNSFTDTQELELLLSFNTLVDTIRIPAGQSSLGSGV